MPRIVECPKCGADISDSYQSAALGIGGGWYCEACDLAVEDDDDGSWELEHDDRHFAEDK